MFRLSRTTVPIAVLVAFVGFGCNRRQAALDIAQAHQSAEQTKRRGTGQFALLVGCTRYDNLKKGKHLVGPANDVDVMRKVLTERFGFADQHIVILSEEQAKQKGIAQRPTRANIQREFKRLSKRAGSGDRVLILLSGHGSQQPDQDPPDPDDPEPDGLDETFLPADTGKWDGDKGVVTNAIVDDELRRWTKAITNKGASLWVIVDSCHSGTALRGTDDEVGREIPAEELVPQNLLDKARRSAIVRGHTRGGVADDFGIGLGQKSAGVAALYASQPSEETFEKNLPPGADGSRRYGLLTFAVCQILTERDNLPTYRELAERVYSRYVHWGIARPPVPLVEGSELDREVLGRREWRARPPIVLARSGDNWRINAGRLHGLTLDSILAVQAPANQLGADKPIGHVRIHECGVLEAVVQSCDYAGMPTNNDLPTGGQCKPVYIDYGPMRLRIAVERPTDVRNPYAVGLMDLEKELDQRQRESDALFEVVEDMRRAEWLVHIRDGRPQLLPSSAGRIEGQLPPDIPRVELSVEKQGTALSEELNKVARAQNLLTLTSDSTTETFRGGSDLKLEAVMLKLRDKNDRKGDPLTWGRRGVTLVPGDHIAWRWTNRGTCAVDVSLLFIDSGYGIKAMFPRPSRLADIRVMPGESCESGSMKVNAETIGREHMVVIAVEGKGPPVDFSFLAQPTLPQTRGEGVDKALDSPLGRLLQHAMYRQGPTRGLESHSIDRHVLHLFTWQVMLSPPSARP